MRRPRVEPWPCLLADPAQIFVVSNFTSVPADMVPFLSQSLRGAWCSVWQGLGFAVCPPERTGTKGAEHLDLECGRCHVKLQARGADSCSDPILTDPTQFCRKNLRPLLGTGYAGSSRSGAEPAFCEAPFGPKTICPAHITCVHAAPLLFNAGCQPSHLLSFPLLSLSFLPLSSLPSPLLP